MCDLPRPGIKPMSSASAGGVFTTEPPGTPGYEVLQSTLRLWPTGDPRFMNGDFETESKIRGSSSVGKASPCNVWETWVRFLGWEFPWRRKWQPTPVFLPGESHGQRSLVGYSSWDRKSQTQLSAIFLSFPLFSSCSFLMFTKLALGWCET